MERAKRFFQKCQNNFETLGNFRPFLVGKLPPQDFLEKEFAPRPIIIIICLYRRCRTQSSKLGEPTLLILRIIFTIVTNLRDHTLTDNLIEQPYWTTLLDNLIGQPYCTALLHNLIVQPYCKALLYSLIGQP